MTKTNKVIQYLTDKGVVEIKSKSMKYRTFENPSSGKLYFIGKRGAVRTGKCSSKSFSITSIINREMNK